MPTLNYTTSTPVARSVMECQTILGKAGASHVSVEYRQGQPVGLSFALTTPHGTRTFQLPVNVDAVHRLLVKQEAEGQFARLRKAKGTFSTPEHAAAVAWRVAKDWLEAQIALLEAQMATLDEVMLPYLLVDDTRTLYAAYKERENALQIEAGS